MKDSPNHAMKYSMFPQDLQPQQIYTAMLDTSEFSYTALQFKWHSPETRLKYLFQAWWNLSWKIFGCNQTTIDYCKNHVLKAPILLMNKILHQLRLVLHPIIYRVSYIPDHPRWCRISSIFPPLFEQPLLLPYEHCRPQRSAGCRGRQLPLWVRSAQLHDQ